MKKSIIALFVTVILIVSACGTSGGMTEILFAGQKFQVRGKYELDSSSSTGARYVWGGHCILIFVNVGGTDPSIFEELNEDPIPLIASAVSGAGHVEIPQTKSTSINGCKASMSLFKSSSGLIGSLYVMQDSQNEQTIAIVAICEDGEGESYLDQLTKDLES